MVTDDRNKILYCVLPKAGSRSWLAYLVRLAHRAKPGHWHFRKPDFMEKAGLQYQRDVPLDDIKTKYRDYFKFAVTRHPLQRFVSAYYEAIVKQEVPTDGKAPNLIAFGRRLVKDLYPRLHWRQYIEDCHFCHVDYNFILRSETVVHDHDKLNEMLGKNVPLQYLHSSNYSHIAENPSEQNNKYDSLLRGLQHNASDSMATVLKVYEADMRLHGYGWDKASGRSSCSIRGNGGRMCC